MPPEHQAFLPSGVEAVVLAGEIKPFGMLERLDTLMRAHLVVF